jgi:butyryl-CoA dehydrogenase
LDFNPCTKHKAVRKTVRKFAETELGPISHEIDRDSRFPWEVIEKMGPLNYFGLQVPKKYGGAGLDTISYAITIEEISRVCAAVGLCVTVHNSVGAYPIVLFGTEDQKERFLPLLASGEYIGAFCLTEANAGSDAGAVETTAVYDNGEYVVNGTKVFVTNGGVCGLAHIFAITDPDNPRSGASVFMVEKNMPGFAVGELEDLCGMRANPVSSLFLEDVRLPETHLLGRLGDGLKIGLSALDTGRIGIAAQALGIAQAVPKSASSLKNRFHPFKPSRTIWPIWQPRLTPRDFSYIAPALSRMPASPLVPRLPWPSFIAAPPPPG